MTAIAVCKVHGTTSIRVKYDGRVKRISYIGTEGAFLHAQSPELSICMNKFVDVNLFGPLPAVPLEFRYDLNRCEISIIRFDPDQVFGFSVRSLVF